LCTEPCPTQCLHMGNNHDLSVYNRASTVVEFTELAKQGLQTPMPIWAQKRQPPEWATRTRQAWLDRAKPKREVMLLAMTERQPAPKPVVAATAESAVATAEPTTPTTAKPATDNR